MSDRDALLAAIRANPDDDTPRLVFADWLDEHEPDTGRRSKKAQAAAPSSWAALIRAECALARLEEEDTAAPALLRFFAEKDEQSIDGVRWDRAEPGVARLVALERRARELRRAAAKTIAAGFPKGNPGVVRRHDGTRRGFPDTFQLLDGPALAAHLPRLLAYCPRVDLTVYHALPNPDELVLEGVAAWCDQLFLTAGYEGHAELVRAMAQTPDTAGVRGLRLDTADAGATARALDTVAGSPHWSGLRDLTLTAPFGPQGVPELDEAFERLLRAPNLRGLRRLRLTNGSPVGFLPLIAALPELRELDLTGCRVGDAGAELLANTPALKNLRFLDLESNDITGAGASALIASPHLTGLAVLHLNHNPIRNLNRTALAGAPQGGLRLIGFHGARLTVRDVGALASSPRLSELVYFDADDNNLPDAAFVRLIQGFGDRAPAILYLTGNSIGEAGIEALTTWPAAANVDMLHLTRNPLATPAAKALAGCPHLQQLSHLCASCSHPAGRKALKARFGARAVV